MTEVFAGLPEQDVLLAEFLLEKFLRRQTRVGIRPQNGGGSLSPAAATTTTTPQKPVP